MRWCFLLLQLWRWWSTPCNSGSVVPLMATRTSRNLYIHWSHPSIASSYSSEFNWGRVAWWWSNRDATRSSQLCWLFEAVCFMDYHLSAHILCLYLLLASQSSANIHHSSLASLLLFGTILWSLIVIIHVISNKRNQNEFFFSHCATELAI